MGAGCVQCLHAQETVVEKYQVQGDGDGQTYHTEDDIMPLPNMHSTLRQHTDMHPGSSARLQLENACAAHLMRTPLALYMLPADLQELARFCVLEMFSADSVIFRSGEQADAVYIVAEGERVV